MASEPIKLPVLHGRSRESAEKAKEYHELRKTAIEEVYAPQLDTAQAAVNDAVFDFELLRTQLNRHPLYWKPPASSLYWPFLALLALAEIPVNRLSFQLFFSDGPVMSLVVAGLVGAILVALAHAGAMVARRFRHACLEPGGGLASSVRLLVITSLIGLLCYGVAVFRQGYLAFITQPDPGLSALLAGDQYGEAALVVLQAGLAIDGWIFLGINVAIVAVGFFVAFYRHDPHPNFEELELTMHTAKTNQSRIEKRRGQEIAAEERRYEAERRRHGW